MKKKKSDVTIIMAVYNAVMTIEKTLESIIAQTVLPDNLIIVNDASRDKTMSIVKKTLSGSKVKYDIINLPINRWVFEARNIGAKTAQTKYIMFLDADDLIAPTYIQECLKAFKNKEVDVVYSDMVEFSSAGTVTRDLPDFDMIRMQSVNYIPYSAMMKLEVFNEYGTYKKILNESRCQTAEWALWLEMAGNVVFGHVKSPLFGYRKEGGIHVDRERNTIDERYQLTREASLSPAMLSVKRPIIMHVCKGREYTDESKMSWEVYSWVKPLESFGQVYCFFYDIEQAFKGMEGMVNAFVDMVEDLKPDYIFHPAYKEYIPLSVWGNISEKYNTIVFFCDDKWRWEEFSSYYCQYFSHIVTTDPGAIEKYNTERVHAILTQWGANSYYHNPCKVKKDIDVSFLGQAYGNRPELFEGTDVLCWGNGWRNGILTFQDMATVMSHSKISISPVMRPDGLKNFTARPFEIAASKTLILQEECDWIDKFFIPEKEVVIYKDKPDMLEKISYYLTHERERCQITTAGYNRFLKDHTWESRFREIFKEVDRYTLEK